MSEIININIGKAGIRIGEHFIDKVSNEHFSTNQSIQGRQHIFFKETKHKPSCRSLFIDLNSHTIDQILLNRRFCSIEAENLVQGTGIQSDIFPTGKYREGSELAFQTVQKIRKQVQNCDLLSGFSVINSIADGAGSGLSSQLLSKLRQEYPNYIFEENIVLPDMFCSPIQVYNSVLSILYLVQNTDLCYMYENSAFLQNIESEGGDKSSMSDINEAQAQCIANITGPYRFSGPLNTNQRKTCVNLVNYPRVKFIASSIPYKKEKRGLFADTLNTKNLSLANSTLDQQKFQSLFSMQFNCRDVSSSQNQINSKINNWMNSEQLSFYGAMVTGPAVSITEQPSEKPSSNVLLNSIHNITPFRKWGKCFADLFRRKAFLYHYTSEGMDEMQFTEAQSSLNDLFSEYTPCIGDAVDDSQREQQQ